MPLGMEEITMATHICLYLKTSKAEFLLVNLYSYSRISNKVYTHYRRTKDNLF